MMQKQILILPVLRYMNQVIALIQIGKNYE